MKISINRVSLLFGMAIAAACTQIQAQGISPIVQEFNKNARGSVDVTNLSDAPKIVSCKAQGFDTDEHGSLQFRPLDPALHIRIDSGREIVGARGSRRVSFDANPSALPAWFAVTCRVAPMERSPGLSIALELSSVVLIHSGRVNPHDVTVTAKRVGAKVEVEVDNYGPDLTRVGPGSVLGHRKQADLRPFVLFPKQKRIIEADWKEEDAAPETVRLQIGKDRFEATVE
jgi:hypothetical protein